MLNIPSSVYFEKYAENLLGLVTLNVFFGL